MTEAKASRFEKKAREVLEHLHGYNPAAATDEPAKAFEHDRHLLASVLATAEQAGCSQFDLVATEAAAMLAETNHGGLSHRRSVSMEKALRAAGIPIPPQCSACPHRERA